MPPDILAIARKMARVIPKPRTKPTKPAQSWRTLKPGQYLTNNIPLTDGTGVAATGATWYVADVDSSGANIATVSLKPITHHLTLKTWQKYFTRARKLSKAARVELLVKELT